MGIRGKNHTFLREHQAIEPVYPVCLFICFLLTYCNISSMGLLWLQEPQGFQWAFSGSDWPTVAHLLFPLQSSPMLFTVLLHNQTSMLIIPWAWKVQNKTKHWWNSCRLPDACPHQCPAGKYTEWNKAQWEPARERSVLLLFSQPGGGVSGHRAAPQDVLLAAKRMREPGFIFM